jgi:hypothetical protein
MEEVEKLIFVGTGCRYYVGTALTAWSIGIVSAYHLQRLELGVMRSNPPRVQGGSLKTLTLVHL